VAVFQTGLKMAIRLIRFGENSAKVDPPALFDTAFTLPDSEPSIHIDPDGSIQAAVVVAKHPGLRTLAVADLSVPKEGQASTTMSDAGRTEAPVSQAWTTHPVALDGAPIRKWLIRTAKGAFGGGDQPISVTTGAPVVGVLRISGATYVLTLDPNRGPRLMQAGF
jgi:hypothetical protein